MKYEITKGSEEDLEGGLSGCTHVYDAGAGRIWCSGEHSVLGSFRLIAERRPITEPVVNQQLTTEWSGEGLPPVGVECEIKYGLASNAEWIAFRCVGVDCGVAFGWAGNEAVVICKGSYEFRPIRSPDEMARDEVIANICFEIGVRPNNIVVQQTYDAIAAGKIPGVKLE